MNNVALIGKIAPEVRELIVRRHTILQTVAFAQPVGRRALATMLGWPERTVRNEIEFLRRARLLHSDAAGMGITESGEQMLSELKLVLRHFNGLSDLEQELAEKLGLKEVIVVPGDSDLDVAVKKDIAAETARFLVAHLVEGDILAVTGGTTLAEVAGSIPEGTRCLGVTVVPARGGLGEEVELQANTIAANIATCIGGSYRLLHVPDDLGEDAIKTLSKDPKIREIIDLIRSARILLHGIGTAEEMASRRGLPPEEVEVLRKRQAVGEAFGYYFDRDAGIVFKTSSMGIGFRDLQNIETVIAVGGGRSKADAAISVLKTKQQDVFITDHGAAQEMLKALRLSEHSSAQTI